MKKEIFTQLMSSRMLLVTILLGAFLLPPWAAERAESETPLIVVAFGDSITRGYGSVVPYPAHLQSLLGSCATVVNQGARGEMTNSGVSRIDSVLAKNKPDYILIMEGANDAFWGVSPSTFRYNIQKMVQKSRLSGAIPIISTITPNNRDPEISGTIPGQYNPAVRSIAAGQSVVLVDTYTNVVGEWGTLSLEGLHPNAAGTVRIAEGFQGAIPCSSGGGGGCFIATAAFGTELEPQVQLLKQFRDQYLLTNSIGTFFVDTYYQYSPPIADFITGHETIRSIVRMALYPLVGFSYLATETNFGMILSLLIFISLLTLTALFVFHQPSRNFFRIK